MAAAQFVAGARALLGAKWRHRGRKPWAVDCIGLVALSARGTGMPVGEDPRLYGREPWDDRLRAGCRERWGDPVPLERATPGHVAIVRWGRGEPSHMGVIGDGRYGGLTLIHAHNIHGVVEQSISGRVAECIVECYDPWRGEA